MADYPINKGIGHSVEFKGSIPSIISSLFLGNVLLKVIVDGFINSEDSMISGGSLINNSSFMSVSYTHL